MNLKQRIMKEMVINDEEAWELAEEIYKENYMKLKEGVTLMTIYNRILELRG